MHHDTPVNPSHRYSIPLGITLQVDRLVSALVLSLGLSGRRQPHSLSLPSDWICVLRAQDVSMAQAINLVGG